MILENIFQSKLAILNGLKGFFGLRVLKIKIEAKLNWLFR